MSDAIYEPGSLYVGVTFRWWVTPFGWLLTGPLLVAGLVTPRRWHRPMVYALGAFVARYGTVVTVVR